MPPSRASATCSASTNTRSRQRIGTSRWAPRSPPTRCWSARATARSGHHQGLPRRAAHRLPGAAGYFRQGDHPARTALRTRHRGGRAPHGRRWRRRGVDLEALEPELARARADGIDAVAIVLMHAWQNPDPRDHRRGCLQARIGFSQISVSHQVSPLAKLVGRGDTTVVDAYLSPILRRYVDQVAGTRRHAFGRTRARRFSS
jgi:N-methylhydantoinase A/oxoprolinase/acetone carboxylase beta subunit